MRSLLHHEFNYKPSILQLWEGQLTLHWGCDHGHSSVGPDLAWSSLDWIWALFVGMCAGSGPNFLTYRQMAHAWASVFLNAQYISRSRLLYITNYKWSEPSMGWILGTTIKCAGLGQLSAVPDPPHMNTLPQSLISTLTIYLLFRMWPTRTRAYTDSLTGHGVMIGSSSTNRAHYHVIQTNSHVRSLRQSKIMTRHLHPWSNQCDCTMAPVRQDKDEHHMDLQN